MPQLVADQQTKTLRSMLVDCLCQLTASPTEIARMTKQQIAAALKMYRAYKCDTRAYRELAQSIGINTGELNRRCWHILHGK